MILYYLWGKCPHSLGQPASDSVTHASGYIHDWILWSTSVAYEIQRAKQERLLVKVRLTSYSCLRSLILVTYGILLKNQKKLQFSAVYKGDLFSLAANISISPPQIAPQKSLDSQYDICNKILWHPFCFSFPLKHILFLFVLLCQSNNECLQKQLILSSKILILCLKTVSSKSNWTKKSTSNGDSILTCI